MQSIRIATRKSPLALWQAENVRDQLVAQHPDLVVELIGMSTEGDKILDVPLATAGGKGLFLKELEQALLDGRADIAVHSMKDVTVALPPGLQVSVMCERADPRDAFVSNRYKSLDELPAGAHIGTSSLRRQAQLKHRFPELQIKTLRGNVNTRLRKLDAGEYDAVILAAAGLKRLGMAARIRAEIPAEISLPAVGQGVMGIECRSDDRVVNELIAPLNHPDTCACVQAERAMNARLGGGCHVPIAGFAELIGNDLSLRGAVGSVDGSKLLFATARGRADAPESIGAEVAEALLAQGAGEILDGVYANP